MMMSREVPITRRNEPRKSPTVRAPIYADFMNDLPVLTNISGNNDWTFREIVILYRICSRYGLSRIMHNNAEKYDE